MPRIPLRLRQSTKTQGNYPPQFPISRNGYFGRKDHGTIRIIESEDPISTASLFFRKLGKGGAQRIFSNSKGHEVCLSVLADKTVISYRKITSTAGSPAVEITIHTPCKCKIKTQKIHFIKKETLW